MSAALGGGLSGFHTATSYEGEVREVADAAAGCGATGGRLTVGGAGGWGCLRKKEVEEEGRKEEERGGLLDLDPMVRKSDGRLSNFPLKCSLELNRLKVIDGRVFGIVPIRICQRYTHGSTASRHCRTSV